MKEMHPKMLSAACKLLPQGLISAYSQTVWIQIRLLLGEQSDLDPHCLLQRHFKGTCRGHTADDSRDLITAKELKAQI